MIPTPKLDAAQHDARALQPIITSLRDFAVAHRDELPARIVDAVELAHAEVLRATHFVTSYVALAKHEERSKTKGGRREY